MKNNFFYLYIFISTSFAFDGNPPKERLEGAADYFESIYNGLGEAANPRVAAALYRVVNVLKDLAGSGYFSTNKTAEVDSAKKLGEDAAVRFARDVLYTDRHYTKVVRRGELIETRVYTYIDPVSEAARKAGRDLDDSRAAEAERDRIAFQKKLAQERRKKQEEERAAARLAQELARSRELAAQTDTASGLGQRKRRRSGDGRDGKGDTRRRG